MKSRNVLALALIVTLCSAGDAWAQRGRGFFGGGFGGGVREIRLVRVEKVKEAIDLTDEQIAKIEEAEEELRQAATDQGGRGGFGNFQDLSDEERQELLAEFRQRQVERVNAEKAKLAEILNENQAQRLHEIYLQVANTDALQDEDVVAALKITEDQIESLRAAQQEAGARRREAFQAGDNEGLAERMAELRKEAEESMLAVLSDEQKTQFAKMKGETIEISQEELAPARGRGRGGRRGGA